MANNIPISNPATRPAGQAGGRPPDQGPAMDSDLSEGPTGAGNGASADFNANSGGTPLIDGWQQIVEPGGAIIAGSNSGMALHRRVSRTNEPTREFLERINPGKPR